MFRSDAFFKACTNYGSNKKAAVRKKKNAASKLKCPKQNCSEKMIKTNFWTSSAGS